MAYYYSITGDAFHPYSEYPTTNSQWRDVIFSSAPSLFSSNIYQYKENGDGYISERRSNSTKGYICYGNNENNSSFDVFFVATTDTYGMGPFYFRPGSRSSVAGIAAGTSNGTHFGVWRIGTISAAERLEPKKFDDFLMVALDNDPDNGYMSNESITISQALSTYINNNETVTRGGEYTGCYDATVAITAPNTLVLGQTEFVVNAESNFSNSNGFVLTVFEALKIASFFTNLTTVLPNSFEKYFLDNELRKTGVVLRVDVNPPDTPDEDKLPMFINGKWQPFENRHQYYYEAKTVMVEIDQTRLPTITKATGSKIDNHNSRYVILMNGYDKLTFGAEIDDQTYPYENNLNNYSGTFALYLGDVLLRNYRATSATWDAEGVVTAIYNGTWGPITVNPSVALNTNQTFSVAYQDRFGRKVSKNLTVTHAASGTSLPYVRFYNYTNPTWNIIGTRVNASGVPDEINGQYAKISYDWALSLLDLSLSPHNNTTAPVIRVTNNINSTTHSYTIGAASGNNTFTTPILIDKSYTFTAVLTDAAGRTFTLSCFVPSGEVFMDFMAGGSGLGIGKRAEAADTLSIGWNTEISEDLRVDGNITGPTITDIYSKIPGAVTSLPASSITVASPLNTSLGANVQAALATLAGSTGSSGGFSCGTMAANGKTGFYVLQSENRAVFFEPIEVGARYGYPTNASFTNTFGGSWSLTDSTGRSGSFYYITPVTHIYSSLVPLDTGNRKLQYGSVSTSSQTITWSWIHDTGTSGNSTKVGVRGYHIYVGIIG